MKTFTAAAALIALCAVTLPVSAAATVSDKDMATAKKFVTAKFDLKNADSVSENTLVVGGRGEFQKDVHEMNGNTTKLTIGSKKYDYGIYTHAPSIIEVSLVKPAKYFTAVIGSDNNDSTSGGRGSIVFSVEVDGKDVYTSKVFHGGDEGQAIKVDLNAAKKFVLEVGDAGDGISCDQAVWANAEVVFDDGTTARVADFARKDYPEVYTAEVPFTFVYNGKPSTELLPKWKVKTSQKTKGNITNHDVVYTDPDTGLQVTMKGVEYADYPVVEWTLWFKNTGKADTPVLEWVKAIDLPFVPKGDKDYILHSSKGSNFGRDDFAPRAQVMGEGAKLDFGGSAKSTRLDMSYFNLENNGTCTIISVGWPGKWYADFARDGKGAVRVTAGQQNLHTVLRPGEEIRSPLMTLLFREGRWIDSQNLWRRWMLDYAVPTDHGKKVKPMLEAASSHFFAEMALATDNSQIEFIDAWLDNVAKIDFWWMDAGWYPCDGSWPSTGTWEVDRERFPNGITPVSDHAHERGVRTLLWFEPERVGGKDNWLRTNHPDWLLGDTFLWLGNEDALNWLIKHVNNFLDENHLDLYRQDFNMDPDKVWSSNDTEDRMGMTENKHVVGYLKYWDAIRANGDRLIDNCASGGMRLDLESMKRSVALHRSDYILEPTGTQNHSYGISLWLPFTGAGARDIDDYVFRSNMHPAIVHNMDARDKSLDLEHAAKLIGQWREIADFYLGDYYPLTPYNSGKEYWMAWQFDDPDKGAGVVQAFRRDEAPYYGVQLKLEAMDKDADYLLRDFDKGPLGRFSGKALAEEGLRIELDQPRSAAVITYEKINK
ncbi:MAG: NPCBM/NEW2 domain-containing protein [Abditibacteriota bacterium]|nr:NPCBM/NEW2 domain-containing protein [Abditibacteriota bacterium]